MVGPCRFRVELEACKVKVKVAGEKIVEMLVKVESWLRQIRYYSGWCVVTGVLHDQSGTLAWSDRGSLRQRGRPVL